MKIKGWEKLSGITYKGLTIVNPIHNADETKYTTQIINFNRPDKPIWKLKVLTNNHKFRMGSTDFFVSIEGENRMSTQTIVSRAMMLKLSNFRQVFEGMVDEILMMEEKLASTISHRINSGGASSGIINMVQNSGTTIDYGKLMSELIDGIKVNGDLKKELEERLKNI